MSGNPVRGLVPVLATPFTQSLDLDLVSLARLVQFQVAAGADGVAIFGMASEAFTLTAAERDQILRVTLEAAEGLPVVAGLSATALGPAREQLQQLAAAGAVVAMVLPPFMVKPSPSQLIDFYGALAAEAVPAGVSLMVQDAPGPSGVTMSPELIVDLAGIDGVDSVKIEAPPTLVKFCAVAEALRGRELAMLGGMNAQFVLDEYACGAIGTMPAAEFTDVLAGILALWNEGERDSARRSYARLLPLIIWGLQSGPAWAIHKEVLKFRGIIECAAVRSPAKPIPAQMMGLLPEVLAQLDLGVHEMLRR